MKEFAWDALEYPHVERGSDWFWTLGIVAAALAVTAIILGDGLFAVVIAVGAFALALFASRPPRHVPVTVNERGVTIDRVLHPFSSLESFYLDEEHYHGPRLLIKSKKPFSPLVSIFAAIEERAELRKFLSSKLKEEPYEQSMMVTLFDFLGL